MTPTRKEHFATGLSAWLQDSIRHGLQPDATLWIDMQIVIGLMSETEAREFERWLEGVQ